MSPVKQRMHDSYRRNPFAKRCQVRSAYQINPFAVRHRALSVYHSNIDHSRFIRREKYAENPLPAKKRAAKQYEKHQTKILHKAAERKCVSFIT